MRNVFTADVTFLSSEQGGRKASPFERWKLSHGRRVPPPLEERVAYYLPDARFDDLPQGPNVMYGLLIEWLEASQDGLRCRMRFAFRADNTGEWAARLHPGSQLQLFEGMKLVAVGSIIDGPFELETFWQSPYTV